MRGRPEVGLVYSGYEAFDSETGETIPWRDRSSEAEGDVLVPLFVRGCFVASLTALFRREVLTRRGLRLRETDFSFGDDYFLWLALSLDWQVARIDEVLARYRRHARTRARAWARRTSTCCASSCCASSSAISPRPFRGSGHGGGGVSPVTI